MRIAFSGEWMRQKRSRLLILAVLVFSSVVGFILVPQLINAYAAQGSTKPISQDRPVIASSTSSVAHAPQAAVDGDAKTRWSTIHSDPQWFAIDFGKTASIKRVVLQWWSAYASDYRLQVSSNGSNWRTIHAQTKGKGGTETVSASGKGRYIRLYAIQSGANNGYSLWEFKVYGQVGNATPEPTSDVEPTPEPTSTFGIQPVQTPTVGAEPALTPTPTSENATSPSGQAMPKGDLSGWHQVFAEDFTTDVAVGDFPGTAYGKKFTVYQDGWPDTAGQLGSPSRYYPSKVVSAKDGMLNLYLHTEKGTPMAAAVLPILKNHLYGKYTIRFKSDSLKGFKTAWLLWPDSQNGGIAAKDGEIDFPEGDLDGTINAFMHPRDGSEQDAFDSGASYTSWHTASIEWTPGKVKFILDGKSIGTSTRAVPNTPMQWVIQTESCLDGCPAASTAGNLQIDWAVAYDPA
ncbi:MAG: discoidin domain-containing protein [Ktedonobacteraceae bacterium]|nr:discoidin domain-containing protein [Ktedonobacteraceae bacterium]